jgi:hypothetical protein
VKRLLPSLWHRVSFRPASTGGRLRATGSKVVGDPVVPRVKSADRDPEVARIEQETLAFLDGIASQIHKYRSPFTTEDEGEYW